MKIYGVTGWKNTGKTGLMVRLVAEMARRGFSVSTLKHAHHDTETDQPGRDSYRHREAGAQEVLLASPRRWALMAELRGQNEPPLPDLLARLSPVDLVLIEGYKSAPHPKIEAHRATAGRDLLAGVNPTIRAVASDSAVDIAARMNAAGLTMSVLDLDDTSAIADFILRDLGLAR